LYVTDGPKCIVERRVTAFDSDVLEVADLSGIEELRAIGFKQIGSDTAIDCADHGATEQTQGIVAVTHVDCHAVLALNATVVGQGIVAAAHLDRRCSGGAGQCLNAHGVDAAGNDAIGVIGNGIGEISNQTDGYFLIACDFTIVGDGDAAANRGRGAAACS